MGSDLYMNTPGFDSNEFKKFKEGLDEKYSGKKPFNDEEVFYASSQLESDIMMELKTLYDLLCKKNKSYGSKNLTEFGELGVLVRMSDKMNRLRNLAQKDFENPLEDESALDTLRDMAGYAIYGILFKNGAFDES